MPTQLQSGQIAPTFSATTHEGEPIDLEAYRGRKVWLAFFRYAACPLCNNRIHEQLQRHREFVDAGIEVMAVFQSSADNIKKYVGRQDPPFPLIADPELSLYRRYGVHPNTWGMFYPRNFIRAISAVRRGFMPRPADSGPLAMIPADFLVDPEGLLWRTYYGKAISDHIPFDDVLAFGADACLDMPSSAS